jgi:hypothetical protein
LKHGAGNAEHQQDRTGFSEQLKEVIYLPSNVMRENVVDAIKGIW